MFRLPGVLCAVTNALPIDQGTNVRAATSAPGTAGKNVGDASLSDYDRNFIRTSAGRDIGGTSLPLVALLHARQGHVQRAREFAADSYATLFEQAVIERLDELIAEARSPRGRATDRLRKLVHGKKKHVHGKKKGDGAVTPSRKELIAAVKEALQSGLHNEQPGPHGADKSYQQILLQDSIEIMIQHAWTAYWDLLQEAKRSDSHITNEQLSKGILDLVKLERRLESPSDDTVFGVNALMVEMLDVRKGRDETAIKKLVDRFRSGDPKAREEWSKIIGSVLGTKRQSQLLGLQDDERDSRMEGLMNEVLRIFVEQDKATLRNLIRNAKNGGIALPKKELDKALVPLLEGEQQMQRRGMSTNDNELQEIIDLVAAASKK